MLFFHDYENILNLKHLILSQGEQEEGKSDVGSDAKSDAGSDADSDAGSQDAADDEAEEVTEAEAAAEEPDPEEEPEGEDLDEEEEEVMSRLLYSSISRNFSSLGVTYMQEEGLH